MTCLVFHPSYLLLEAWLFLRTGFPAAPSWWTLTPQQHVRHVLLSVGSGEFVFPSIASFLETLLFNKLKVCLCYNDQVMLLPLLPIDCALWRRVAGMDQSASLYLVYSPIPAAEPG